MRPVKLTTKVFGKHLLLPLSFLKISYYLLKILTNVHLLRIPVPFLGTEEGRFLDFDFANQMILFYLANNKKHSLRGFIIFELQFHGFMFVSL